MTTAFTHHGGRLAHACAHYGGRREDWIDLSTGINPNAWPSSGSGTTDWRALPDPEALARLERAAARHFGCAPALCAAVPGSETGLRLLGLLLERPGLYQPLGYGTYRSALADGEEIADLANLPARATALMVGNPNNPDGALISRHDLLVMCDHQERHGGWLIVDEAFADHDPRCSVADTVGSDRRLIVLRSFGKFFGLAGLRLGFIIAPPLVLEPLRRTLGDWPVHAAGLELGTAAYDDAGWIERTRIDLAQRAAGLDAVLARHGLTPRGACPLFRLVATPAAPALFEVLARQRILTRPFASHPHLLRVGLPADENALDRLDRALG